MNVVKLIVILLALTFAPSKSMAKTLVVYYSYTNHVKELVDELTGMVDADVVRIEPTDKSGGYELNGYAKGSALLNAIRQNPDDLNSYPGIDPVSIKWDEYDKVVIGMPLWWRQMAAVMQTFLFMNREQLATKQLYLMVSSQSSGISGVEEDARRLVPDGNFVSPSLWVNHASHANRHSLISEWVARVNLSQPTAIRNPENNLRTKPYEAYDLMGRKVANPRKGLFIVNGKKVIGNK